MADVSEKVACHLESVEADEILSRRSQVEKIDTVAARSTFTCLLADAIVQVN
jgi:hypothetical protein